MDEELFTIPRRIVWGYRLLAVALLPMWLAARNPVFLLSAVGCVLVGQWLAAQAVMVTPQAVLVSRVRGGPRRAPHTAIMAVQDDVSRWVLRMVDGSEVVLPPVRDRDAVVAAIRRYVPRLPVDRRVRAGGLLARWRRRPDG